MSASFVHLQVHSEYSLLEGIFRIPELIKKTKSHHMTSVALTDHGTLHAAVQFYLKAKSEGINPILGCELLVTPSIETKQKAYERLILLCENETGYKNLIQLVSIAHLKGFYYKARIDLDHLSQYSKGLIAISPGFSGVISDPIARHRHEEAKKMAESLKEIYPTSFYIGLSRLGRPFEDLVVSQSVAIAAQLGIPIVATNDVYYPEQQDAYLKEVVHCIQFGKRLGEEINKDSDQHYFKSSEDMLALFQDLPEAISNTVEIASRCQLILQTDQVMLPHFNCPEGHNSESYLRLLVEKGLKERYTEPRQELIERINFELETINRMNFANYFLIIFDFLDFCYQQNIPVGPGRGSVVGSLVAYCLRITQVDPIRYQLLFERFLNPERISMPDVDTDFCIRRRGEVIQYIINRYGTDRVAQIATFGTMQGRGVIRDVGRVLNVPLADVDKIAKLIPSSPGHSVSIPEALIQVPELKNIYEEKEEYKKLLDIGAKLEGQSRHTSTHAAGVVISRDPLQTVVPLMLNDGQVSTQYDMTDIEKMGLLKMDILGLRNLTVIQDALVYIQQYEGMTLDLENLPMDDTATFNLLRQGSAIGVFQLEASKGMRALLKEMKPQLFEDLIALLALYRPGPLGSGMVKEFISNKLGKTKPSYELPVLEPILKETHGLILYQEQVMQIANVVAGFTLGQSDMLRRAMGKKKKEEMDAMRALFLKGAEKNQHPVQKAGKIFDLCYKFSEYGFNKSHSAAYALISYQTAYLKANHTVAYMTALLSSVLSSGDRVSLYTQECVDLGISILPPSVNGSNIGFSISSDPNGKPCIRFGLGAIKNVGEAAIENMIESRPKNGYQNFFEFCVAIDLRQCNKRVLESLIKSGACDELGDRSYLLAHFEELLELAQKRQRQKLSGQIGLFLQDQETPYIEKPYTVLSVIEKLRLEKDMMGLYLSGHPLDAFSEQLAGIPHDSETITQEPVNKILTVAGLLTEVKKVITKSGKEMITATLEDLKGSILLLSFSGKISAQTDDIVKVVGKVRHHADAVGLVILDMQLLQGTKHQNKHVFIDLDSIDHFQLLQDLKTLITQYKGTSEIYFKIEDTLVKAHQKYAISVDAISPLTTLLGQGRVWMQS